MTRFLSRDAENSFYFGVERRFEFRYLSIAPGLNEYGEEDELSSGFWEVHIGWFYFGRV